MKILLIFFLKNLKLVVTEPDILIRQNVDFNKVISTGYFCYFLIKIRYKYD